MESGKTDDDEEERLFYAEDFEPEKHELSQGIGNSPDEPERPYGHPQNTSLQYPSPCPKQLTGETKSTASIPGLGLLRSQADKGLSQNQSEEYLKDRAPEEIGPPHSHDERNNNTLNVVEFAGSAVLKIPSEGLPKDTKRDAANSDPGKSARQDDRTGTQAETVLPHQLPDATFEDVTYSSSLKTLETGDGAKADEYEFDSSDGESTASSRPISSSDSDASGETESNIYDLLSAEEQARILMQDGGSDDEKKPNKSDSFNQPRTVNEITEQSVQKPNITITPAMNIFELGCAEGIVENFLLIRGKTSGESQVLESGSTVCLEDRTVLGVISETLGRVEAPLYSIAFPSAQEAKGHRIVNGTKIFYVEEHSTFVFTQPLKTFKGSDASNIHDEEIGADEVEFSDDEAEAEHRRRTKQLKLAKKYVTQGQTSTASHPRGPAGWSQQGIEYPDKPISYDEEEGDEIYIPLARPDNFLEHRLPSKPIAFSHRPRGASTRGRDGRNRAHRFQRGNAKNGRNERNNAWNKATIQNPTEFSPSTGIHLPSTSPISSQPGFPLKEQPNSPSIGVGHSAVAFQNALWQQNSYSQWNANNPYNSSPYPTSYHVSEGGSIPVGSFVNPAFVNSTFFRNSQTLFPVQAPYYQHQESEQPSKTQRPYDQGPSKSQASADPASAHEEYDPSHPWIK